MLLRDTCILSVCACPYVCVNVCGCDCVFARPQCKYLILCLYCVAVCHSASHATINTRGGGQASLNSSSVCWKTSRYHWQAQIFTLSFPKSHPEISLHVSFFLSCLLLFFLVSIPLYVSCGLFLNSCFFLCSLWSLVLHLCIVSLILCQPNTAR